MKRLVATLVLVVSLLLPGVVWAQQVPGAVVQLAQTPDGNLWFVVHGIRVFVAPQPVDDSLYSLSEHEPAYDGSIVVTDRGLQIASFVDEVPAPTFSSSGSGNTRPFTLSGGDYRMAWRAVTANSLGCSVGVRLVNTQSGQEAAEFSAIVSSQPEGSAGESWAYRVRAGRYFLRVTASLCRDWTLTISPGA